MPDDDRTPWQIDRDRDPVPREDSPVLELLVTRALGFMLTGGLAGAVAAIAVIIAVAVTSVIAGVLVSAVLTNAGIAGGGVIALLWERRDV